MRRWTWTHASIRGEAGRTFTTTSRLSARRSPITADRWPDLNSSAAGALPRWSVHHAARMAASTAGTRGDICSSSHRLPVPQSQRDNVQSWLEHFEKSVKNLTWSYAAFLSAVRAATGAVVHD